MEYPLLKKTEHGAQRLSASEGKTVQCSAVSSAVPCVLNAFRHQRGKQFDAGNIPTRRINGAQRLSASEGKTGDCSTGHTACAGVLNAFRHQRGKQVVSYLSDVDYWEECSTPFGIRGENRCTQDAPRRFLWCAQRLSASEGKTVCPPRSETSDHSVLNAFRHQRGKQIAQCRRRQSRRAVLNAFRHQRGKQLRRTAGTRSEALVLNAFRHQRGKQH